MAALSALLARPDIDAIRLIVSGRSRPVGAAHVLPPHVAVEIWRLFIAADPAAAAKPISLEIAPGSAIEEVLRIAAEAAEDCVLCLGESDFLGGDVRFAQSGAEIFVAPTRAIAVRSTDLREALTRPGDPNACERFASGMPPQLDAATSGRAFRLCLDAVAPADAAAADPIRRILAAAPLPALVSLTAASAPKADVVFRATFDDGAIGYVKHAGDTVGAGEIGRRDRRKPKRRIAAECRALRALTSPAAVDTPKVLYQDKKAKLSLLTAVLEGGESLSEALIGGRFSPEMAVTLGAFLASLHESAREIDPFWGDAASEAAHWRLMLQARTISLVEASADDDAAALLRLHDDSAAQARRGVFHLDLNGRNIRCGAGRIGIIDFEFASTLGDPALDAGAALAALSPNGDGPLTDGFWRGYLGRSGATDDDFMRRAECFARLSPYFDGRRFSVST